MAKEISTIMTFEGKAPLFLEFCKEKGLKVGDKYHSIDFINWIDEMDKEKYFKLTGYQKIER